jgi:hypothetical protein
MISSERTLTAALMALAVSEVACLTMVTRHRFAVNCKLTRDCVIAGPTGTSPSDWPRLMRGPRFIAQQSALLAWVALCSTAGSGMRNRH